jgi:hypothetical protein
MSVITDASLQRKFILTPNYPREKIPATRRGKRMGPVIQLDAYERPGLYKRQHKGHTPPEVGAADASSAMANPIHIIKALATSHCITE